MKKTHLTDLLTNIKATRVSFVSIIMFVVLALAIFFSFSWVKDSLPVSTNDFVERYNLHDIRICSIYGFSDEDVARINDLDIVSQAEGRNYVYSYFCYDDTKYLSAIFQITNDIDTLFVSEGTLPNKCGEIAVDKNFAKKHGIKLNDTIKLSSDVREGYISTVGLLDFDSSTDDIEKFYDELKEESSQRTQKYLNTDEYVVTAIVTDPEYASVDPITYGINPENGISIDAIFFVDKLSFASREFLGYNDILIRCDSLRGLRYDSDEYIDLCNECKDKILSEAIVLSDVKKQMVEDKQEEIKASVDKKLEDAQKQIDDAKKTIDEKQSEIDNGKKQLEDAGEEIASANKLIIDGAESIEKYEDELEEGWNKLQSAKAEIDNGRKELQDGKTEYLSKCEEWLEGYRELEEGKAQYEEGKAEYEYYKCQYDGAKADYEKACEVVKLLHQIDLDIELGTVTKYNYKEYKNKWMIDELVRILKEIINKYGPEYGINVDFLDGLLDRISQLGGEVEEEEFTIKLNDFWKNYFKDLLAKVDDTMAYYGRQLEEKEKELAKGIDELHGAEEEINHGQAKLDYYKMELDDALVDIADGEKKLEDAEKQYADGLNEYNTKKNELEEGKREWEEKSKELEAAKVEALNGEKKLNEGIEKLEIARAEFDKALSEYNEKSVLIRNELDSSAVINTDTSCSAVTRNTLIYLSGVIVTSNIIGNIRFSLAGLFTIVGVFVCYSAITRMVFSQKKIIGTKKALGYTDREIISFYISYVLIAAVSGCVIGTVIGYVLEKVILAVISNSFAYDRMICLFDIKTVILMCLLEILLILITAYVANKNVLSKSAIDLLSGNDSIDSKTRFYERYNCYKKVSFLNKIIINNTFTDKRRVIGTVIGIAGCTALLVTSICFYFNFNKSFNVHFDDIWHYKYKIFYDNSVEGCAEEITKVVSEYTDEMLQCQEYFCLIKQPTGMGCVNNVCVYDDKDKFNKMISILPVENITGKGINEGLWLNYSYRNYYPGEQSEYINLASVTGDDFKVPVDGYMEYYLTFSSSTIDKDSFLKYFNIEYSPNEILLSIDDDMYKELEARLSTIEGFNKISDFYQISKITFSTVSVIAAALVGVYGVISVIMSILVLLNLLNQFVEEKKRELIVMLINGFKYKDAKRYIYADTILLAIVGIIIGTLSGIILAYFTIKSFDSPMIYCIRSVNITGCLVGISGALILTFIMCMIAIGKIDKFKLTDIMK